VECGKDKEKIEKVGEVFEKHIQVRKAGKTPSLGVSSMIGQASSVLSRWRSSLGKGRTSGSEEGVTIGMTGQRVLVSMAGQSSSMLSRWRSSLCVFVCVWQA
jgi:hypothetical protein